MRATGGGSVIEGDLISWNGQQAVVKAEFGSMTFRRNQLSQATIQRLELLSGDPHAVLREKFAWSWESVPLSERVTNPAKGR